MFQTNVVEKCETHNLHMFSNLYSKIVPFRR